MKMKVFELRAILDATSGINDIEVPEKLEITSPNGAKVGYVDCVNNSLESYPSEPEPVKPRTLADGEMLKEGETPDGLTAKDTVISGSSMGEKLRD